LRRHRQEPDLYVKIRSNAPTGAFVVCAIITDVMPSPKAILRDVADLGLDPKAQHTVCARDGRIKVTTVVDDVPSVVTQPTPVQVLVEKVEPEQSTVQDAPIVEPIDAKVELQADQSVKIEQEKKPVKHAPKKKVDEGQVS